MEEVYRGGGGGGGGERGGAGNNSCNDTMVAMHITLIQNNATNCRHLQSAYNGQNSADCFQ